MNPFYFESLDLYQAFINHARYNSTVFFRLNDLNLENIGQSPILIKIGVIICSGLSIVGLGYWLIIQTTFGSLNTLQQREASLKKEFQIKQQEAVNLRAYRNQLQLMNARFVTMQKQLSAQNEMPGLLEEISKTGVRCGLRFELFAPQVEVHHDFYVELPIKITVVGTYMHLALFISRVAEMSRVVTLHEFSMSYSSKEGVNEVSLDELTMTLMAKIYRYRLN